MMDPEELAELRREAEVVLAQAEPLRDRVIVRARSAEERSKGGIILPESSREQEAPSDGVVMAVGQGKILENGMTLPMIIQVGDNVLFGKYSGYDLTIGEISYKVMREDEIMVKLKDPLPMDPTLVESET